MTIRKIRSSDARGAARMLRVGLIDYINSLPFSAAFSLGAHTPSFDIVKGVPTFLNQSLAAGKLDLSFISAAEYLRNRQNYTLLSSFCIGARERVLSVLLYLRGSLQSLDGQPIGITPQSASSVALLEILCHRFWGIRPHFVPLKSLDDVSDYAGLLLIGDVCLTTPVRAGFHTIDLAQAWYHATGMPFTFAVVAVRNEVMLTRREEVRAVELALERAFSWSEQHRDALYKLAETRFGLSQTTIQQYYSVLRYRLDSEQQRALEHFDRLKNAHT